MKNIICPTDFTNASLNAANYAADMACSTGADLLLLHMYPDPMTDNGSPYPSYDVNKAEKTAKLNLLWLKESLLKRTNNKINIDFTAKGGDVISGITAHCKRIKPYAVVMGPETKGAIERWLFGGETISAIQHLEWPLIIVPSGVTYQHIYRIGLACDLRNVASSVKLSDIKNIIRDFNADLYVLNVSKESSEALYRRAAKASQLLYETFADINAFYYFLDEPNVEIAINRFARENALDMLIVIPKSHTILSKIFSHSHSKKILLSATIPVMTIHE